MISWMSVRMPPPAFCGALDESGNRRAVAEGEVAADAVDGELLREVPEQTSRIGGEKSLVFADAVELPAIRQHTGGIDGWAEFEADADERID